MADPKDIKKTRMEFNCSTPESPLKNISYSNALGNPSVTLTLAVQDRDDPLIDTVVSSLLERGFTNAAVLKDNNRPVLVSVDIPTPAIHRKIWQIEKDRARVESVLESIPALQFTKNNIIDDTYTKSRAEAIETAVRRKIQKRDHNTREGRR